MAAHNLSWTSRLIYGVGKSPDIIKLLSFDTFILFYYSQVLGLPGTLAGLTIFLVICADAAWDPIVGTFSDGLKSARFGRRLTPMIYASLPAAIAFYLLFSPPHGLPTMALFAWMLGSAIFLRCTMTFYQIPYISLQAELSDLRSDRATLVILASLFRMVTEFALIYIAFHYFFNATPAFPNGQQDPDAYPRFGLAFGIALGVLMVLCAASLYPSVRRMRSYSSSAPRRVRGLLSISLWRKVLFNNRDFRALVLGIFTFAIATGLNTAFHLYLGTYLFHLSPPQMAEWRQAINVGGFISLILVVTYVLRRFEIKPTFVASMAAYGVIETALVVLYLTGLWPTQLPVIWLLLAGNFVLGCVNAVNMVTPAMLCSISADDYEYRTKEPQQGLLFGLVHFSQKAGTGVGNLIAGIFLDVVKFPKGASVASVDAATIAPVAWFYVAGILAASVLAVWAFRGYRLSNADHDVVIDGLNERRAEALIAESDGMIGAPMLPATSV
jgi:GPH family glycoside/pentoside/hexuronide:cation symporter